MTSYLCAAERYNSQNHEGGSWHCSVKLNSALPHYYLRLVSAKKKTEFSATCQTKKRCCLMNGSNRETWIAIIHYEDPSKRLFLFKNFKCIRINPFQDDCLIYLDIAWQTSWSYINIYHIHSKTNLHMFPCHLSLLSPWLPCQWPSAQLRKRRILWYPTSLRRRSKQADRRLHGISDAWLAGKFACQ